ncbi:hypothetical protein STCU_03439 [Strigomonas culicis]|uniref:Heat shock protein 70 (HSP70)-interacting protein n=1 Tax=Strigomonas culicis TaxID=28005 RepID=S9VWM8_9TRYP|nr:heat shock protein 70 (HSP70)-interacting protein [Strigomonas culicis]EPY31471.1 hypothetical protein STCU_03439 [Strigomonas culicis]|eukprot:EPY23533.1 heat shock protein 70 (HSP70)-interacting protein [Strigomonas culicis]
MSSATGTAANASSPALPPMNDQNNGDLYRMIESLKLSLTTAAAGADATDGGGGTDIGEMPVETVLLLLQGKNRPVFAQVDQLRSMANKIAGLDEDMARRWKEKGNADYSQRKHMDAIMSYSNGLLCAESSETVAVLLNNRSTAFFELQHYADACMDADRALSVKPDYTKALLRRGRCLLELGFREAGERDTAAAAHPASGDDGRNTPAEIERLFGDDASEAAARLSLPHRVELPPLPDGAATAMVRVERSQKGRGLVAAARVPAGVTVMAETPIALVPRLETLLSVCSFCLQYTTTVYHGAIFQQHKKKSRGFFCTERCAERAWHFYGEAESQNPFFLFCPNDALLASRLVRARQQLSLYSDARAAPEGLNMDLQTHLQTLEGSFTRELVQPSPTAASGGAVCMVGGSESIVAALALYLGVFSAPEAEQFRKAMRQVTLNGTEVRCALRVPTPASGGAASTSSLIHTTSIATLGKALYPYLSLLNHSCDPNSYLSFVGNPQSSSARAVVRTLRPVMEGEEFTIAYLNISDVGVNTLTPMNTGGAAASQPPSAPTHLSIDCFRFHSLRQRLQLLRGCYGFLCHCQRCGGQVDEPVLTAEKEYYVKSSDLYQKGRRLIREGQYEAAVTVLLQSYEMVMRYICPPPRPPQPMLPKTHDALALAYFHLQNKAKCFEHLKAALECDVAIHQTDRRVELINDYTRLAFLAPTEEDRRLYAGKASELLDLFYAPSSVLDLQKLYIESSRGSAADKAASA